VELIWSHAHPMVVVEVGGGAGRGWPRPHHFILFLRLHILFLLLELPELRLDGDGGLLRLRVAHVDVKVLRHHLLLLTWKGNVRSGGQGVTA